MKKKPLPPAPICKEPVNNTIVDEVVYEVEDEHPATTSASNFPASFNKKPDAQSRVGTPHFEYYMYVALGSTK